MWFGTEDGLNRFDGYSFDVYAAIPRDPASLSHNFVWAVTEDAQGGLWVGTEGGLNRRAPGPNGFTRLRHDPEDATTVGARLRLGPPRRPLGRGLGRHEGRRAEPLRSRAAPFKRYRHDPARADSLPHDDVRALLESRSGAIWVGTLGGGLARLDPASGRFTRFRHAANDRGACPTTRCARSTRTRRGGSGSAR